MIGQPDIATSDGCIDYDALVDQMEWSSFNK